jgi:hypothetical protein
MHMLTTYIHCSLPWHAQIESRGAFSEICQWDKNAQAIDWPEATTQIHATSSDSTRSSITVPFKGEAH